MRFYEFKKEVEKRIKTYFDDKAEITISTVEKNNGVFLEALVIKERGEWISPTIYINCFYERFLNGMEIEDIVKEIYETYQSCRQKPMEGVEFFSDFERVKDLVVYKLIHAERNSELLKKIPHIPYLDMAIVFYSIFYQEDYGNGTILIYNKHMQMWNTNKDVLYEYAQKNTPVLLPYYLTTMESVMHEIYSEEEKTQKGIEIEFARILENEASKLKMYVLSNQKRYFGAAAILYPDLLKNFGFACGRDFYILPSSIHEVILIPARADTCIDKMSEIVEDINTTQMPVEEILSDRAYYYDRESGELQMTQPY